MEEKKGLVTLVDKVLESDTLIKARTLFGSKTGVKMIAAISFLESAFPFPILTDPFLVAAILANRANAIRLVLVTTLASVLGGVVAYLTAMLFLDILLQWVGTNLATEFEHLVVSNEASTGMLTLIGAFTPVPYTLVAWALVAIQGSLLVFIIASIIGRGARYAIVGYCTHRFGSLAMEYARKYIGISSILLFVLVALYVWYKM
jgi:membrane protein YqaA with SNARE-associated domain